MKKSVWLFFGLTLILSCGGIIFYQKLSYQKQLGHLYINVQNSNAQIVLDGKNLGTTPVVDYQLLAGFYPLRLITDTYQYETTIRLNPQTATIINWQAGNNLDTSSGLIYELIPLADKNTNQLIIQTLPDRALLHLSDSRDSNFTPYQSQALQPTTYQGLFSLPGYQDLAFSFTVSNGYQLQITAKLATQEEAID